MVFAKRVEEYMQDEAEKEGEEHTKLGTKEDETGKQRTMTTIMMITTMMLYPYSGPKTRSFRKA